MTFSDNYESEEIFERFIELSKRAMFIDISQSNKPLDDFALQKYVELSTL